MKIEIPDNLINKFILMCLRTGRQSPNWCHTQATSKVVTQALSIEFIRWLEEQLEKEIYNGKPNKQNTGKAHEQRAP